MSQQRIEMDLSEDTNNDTDTDASLYCGFPLCGEHVCTHTCDTGNSHPGNCVLLAAFHLPKATLHLEHILLPRQLIPHPVPCPGVTGPFSGAVNPTKSAGLSKGLVSILYPGQASNRELPFLPWVFLYRSAFHMCTISMEHQDTGLNSGLFSDFKTL